MSVRVMTAVWDITLADSEKIVLLALADCANDEGWCWPGMKSLARKCSKTDRTVQASIKALCAAGHLTRIEVPGKGCRYQVHPRSGFTPEAASPPKPVRAPPKPVRDTPEAASDKPSKNHKYPSGGRAQAHAATVPDDDLGDDRDLAAAPPPVSAGAGKPHVLPADWEPPTVGDLPPDVAAMVRQWPAGAYPHFAANFRDHWSLVDRKSRTAKGHAGALNNWLRRVHPEAMRAGKAGVAYGAGPSSSTAHAAPPRPVQAQARQDDRSAAIHAALASELGAAIHAQWLGCTAILVSDGGVVVVTPTAFVSAWLADRFKGRIEAAAGRVTGSAPQFVRFEVEDNSRRKAGKPARSAHSVGDDQRG